MRNMLVITVLIAGAYFRLVLYPDPGYRQPDHYGPAAIDYLYHYRADQDMISQADVRQMPRRRT